MALFSDGRGDAVSVHAPAFSIEAGAKGEYNGEKKGAEGMDAVKKARALLEEVTPLKSDCGRVCGARCCASLEGEETGMLLFPGEEDLYEDAEGWKLLPAGQEMLLICPGTCRRQERPLACRMFPLLPLPGEEGAVTGRVDERSRGVCPLAKHGKRGMDPAFTEAVRAAGEALLADADQRAFLERLRAEQEELKQLRILLGAAR